MMNDPAQPTLSSLLAWLEQRRRQGQVVYDDKQESWQVLGHPETGQVLSDPTTFSSDLGDLLPHQEDLDLFQRGNFVRMDPPRHHKLRGLVSQAFTPKVVAELAPRIADVTNELLDAVDGSHRFDLIDDLAYPLPVIVIAELLGIPAEDRPTFRRWADDLFRRTNVGPDVSLASATRDVEPVVPIMREMNSYLLAHVRARRANPADDLTSRLTTAEVDGERLDEEEIIGFVGLLLIAGHITTTATVGNSIICFDEHPSAAAEVRADPATMPAAIEEVLRLRTPFPRLARRTTAEVEIGGAVFPAKAIVVPWLIAANRDERVFTDPNAFDVHRKPNPHLTFGQGIHYCLGAPLARLEARIALKILLDRYRDIAVSRDGGVEHRNPWVMISPSHLLVDAHAA
jgi:cytochrome P450